MIKKILTVLIILLIGAACVIAGIFLLSPNDKPTPEPEVPLPPGITRPEGRVISTNPKIVEGRITKLTDNEVCISVQKVEWSIVLDETSRTIVNTLNEKGVEIRKGTFVCIHYKEENGKRIATNVLRVDSN